MTDVSIPLPTVATFPEFVDFVRIEAATKLEPNRRSLLGQFFTSSHVARLMASLSSPTPGATVRLLDPGAGVGVLAAAWVTNACALDNPPKAIEVTAYELDPTLLPALRSVVEQSREYGRERGVDVSFEIRNEDFVQSAVDALGTRLFGATWPAFDAAILNPPYKKIRADGSERRLLRDVGLETGNLYAAFVGLTLRALVAGGELVAITPRSFCNGPYFTAFRRDLLHRASLTHIHVFDSRSDAFGDDKVLQENVVFRVERGREQAASVQIEWSAAGNIDNTVRREVAFTQVVRPGDSDKFIHIAADEWDSRVANLVRALRGSLETLGVQVSTGRVVDFRARGFLSADPQRGTVPLIYPTHLANGQVEWPKLGAKKPNALFRNPDTENLLNATGTYVLAKRFSSKEERRRLVAAVFTPDSAPGEFVAFENHLNYFHRQGRGLPKKLALGLAAYLNSTLLDAYFRTFNGHTQVNATDLRKLPYPKAEQLERIADRLTNGSDDSLDEVVEGELLDLPKNPRRKRGAAQRIEQASSVLKALGLPREQSNERAALCLLALLDLDPLTPWADASAPLRRVTPIMEFAASAYGKHWKPNTRETIRRQTLHQFLDAGLVRANPDNPDRPTNSPAFCYQVPDVVLELLRSFGGDSWEERLRTYQAASPTLAAQYASEREMTRIPLRLKEGMEIRLSPGGQNELIRKIIEEFCPRFTPGGRPVYVGDAETKMGYFDREAFAALSIELDKHGKMPDVVVDYVERGWLVVVEAVTSHGPVNAKRRRELKSLFASSAPLVYVTAFLNRQALAKHMSEIAWETEVWVADAPSHMIHFNGERFLGPYD